MCLSASGKRSFLTRFLDPDEDVTFEPKVAPVPGDVWDPIRDSRPSASDMQKQERRDKRKRHRKKEREDRPKQTSREARGRNERARRS